MLISRINPLLAAVCNGQGCKSTALKLWHYAPPHACWGFIEQARLVGWSYFPTLLAL